MTVATIETHRRRLLLVATLLLAVGLVLTIRLVQWQVLEHEQMRALAEAQHSTKIEISPRRGTIRDRNGRVLAISLRNDQVIGDPDFFKAQMPKAKDYIISTAATILDMTPGDLRARLESGEGHYLKLKNSIPITASKKLNDAGLSPAIVIERQDRRVYPSGALLAHTLGFINSRGEGVGIEGSYNQQLSGVPGFKLFEGENYGQGLGNVPSITPAQDGADITLTVDLNIQYMAERELERALAAEKTLTGTIVIMNPKTGEILAMAGRPTFDPNQYDNVPVSVYNNPVISAAWEPGSIVKILTMAAALDTGKISPRSTFVDRGSMTYHHMIITNMDKKANGTITPAQILQYSSNVGIVQVADVLSTTAFYTYMRANFGIGSRTGIDLPFEVEGSIRLPGDPGWNPVDLATHSYGQGMAVTPIQMTTAVAAIANKGIMMRPHVVAGVQGGLESPEGPGPLRRVVKSETAATLTDMLVSVVETTVTQARVPGYRLAGKTGTALIPPPEGTYSPDETIASFIGYGPAEDPRFVILVRIDRPQVHQTGADVAAPVFRNIAQWLLAYLKIPPSDQQTRR